MLLMQMTHPNVTLRWTEGKKHFSIDSGILWGHADMYKSLLGQKN